MVVGTNLTATGIPGVGCGEDYSVQTAPLCENSVTVRQPRSQAPVWLDSCALLHAALLPVVLVSSTLIQSALAALVCSSPLE